MTTEIWDVEEVLESLVEEENELYDPEDVKGIISTFISGGLGIEPIEEGWNG